MAARVTSQKEEDFPKPIVNILEALSDKQRRRMILYINREDASSWTQLSEFLGLEKGTLNHHLNELEAAGMIRNFSKEVPEDRYHSYYELTPLAERTIAAIFDAFRPEMQFSVGRTSAASVSYTGGSAESLFSRLTSLKATVDYFYVSADISKSVRNYRTHEDVDMVFTICPSSSSLICANSSGTSSQATEIPAPQSTSEG
jgi:DNA-binding MarR family transcriptional regulator